MTRPDNWRELGLGTAPERIAANSIRVGECLEYRRSQGCQIRISVNGHSWLMTAYCVSYLIHVGDIPDDKCVQRTCGNRHCVEPKCLVLADSGDIVSENVKRRTVANHHANEASRRQLSKKQVFHIRKRAAVGLPIAHLAIRYGVSEGLIYSIANRFIYRSLGEIAPSRGAIGKRRRFPRASEEPEKQNGPGA